MKRGSAAPLLVALFVSFVAILSLIGNEPKSSDLVDIEKISPGIIVDLPYATEDNFCNAVLYPMERCFLRRSVALRLHEAQRDLESLGYGLKIWDGYRPRSVQYKMWEVSPKKGYVANPAWGSRHNRGAAVDVTLVNADGGEMEMPTDYDHFSFRAHAYYSKASPEALRNRKILQKAMTENGFAIMKTEWWHFDAIGWRNFPLENEPIPDLAELADTK